MAAPRLVAVGMVAILLTVGGCTYSAKEPGLFGESQTPRPAETSLAPLPPEKTNPQLPVIAQAEWTSGDRVHATVRFAVHAVRRTAQATILDWSVTPLSAQGFQFGDTLPFLNLGLSRDGLGDLDITLVDPATRTVYRAGAHRSARQFNRCLCTPLWLVQQGLRVGETRLLQAAYPPLPAGLDRIQVDLANLAPFSDVPVSPLGTVPTAGRPVDLARAATEAADGRHTIRYTDRQGGQLSIRIGRVVADSEGTAMEWTVTAIGGVLNFDVQPPVTAAVPDQTQVTDASVVNGPQLRAHGSSRPPLKVSWVTSQVNGHKAYECLCSTLGLWSGTLKQAGGYASVASNYPALPTGTRSVDVALPGVGVLRNIPLARPAAGSHPDVGAPTSRRVETWTYQDDRPPRGWPTSVWPTPLPDPSQYASYRFRSDKITSLPGA